MDILIRQVRPGDEEAIVRILNAIIEAGAYTVLDTPLTVEAEREFMASFPQRGLFHVAEDPQRREAVGFQTLEPFATYTRAFDHVGVIATFVDLSLRRRGIGTRLAEVTLREAKRDAYEKVFTYVRADNEAALEFYRRLGFRVVGRAERQAKLGGSYVDEIIIERFL